LNDKQRAFFKALKEIKDANVEVSDIKLQSKFKTKGPIYLEEEYKIIQAKINSTSEIEAFKNIQNNIIEDVICDIMVMFDGYGTLKYPVDLIEKESNKSLKNEIELHDSFMNYLYEVEDNQ
jgi:predicted site-specific integrase-resolvase